VVSCTSYFEIRRRRFFFLQVVSRKKEKNQVLTSYLQEGYEICHLVFFVLRVPQVKKAKDFFTEELHTMAVEIREAKEAIESTRAGLLPQKGDVRKKRKRPRKVVCCNKRGTWERKEKNQGRWSVATRKGREKNKKRKEKKKTKEGEKVAPAKARFHVTYTENSFFWFMSIWA
jgi:hypothetical protein